ncbi:MAG: hypothetical protein WD766_09330 [Gemmatimonadota bacterium]
MDTLDLDIRLGGHPTTHGTLDAALRPGRERYGRAAGTLALSLVIAAAVFFIPPHIPWVAAALLIGLFLSYRQLRSEYTVHRFAGACPRCGTQLRVANGEQIRFPLELTCFECHHEPVVTPSQA